MPQITLVVKVCFVKSIVRNHTIVFKWQMASQFNYWQLTASRTFAYNCLAKGLNESVTWFSSFVKHYLDPCLAANVCPLCMDDIAAGVNFFEELIPSLRKTDDSVMYAFSEMNPSATDTLVTALTKLSPSQEAMDNRLN